MLVAQQNMKPSLEKSIKAAKALSDEVAARRAAWPNAAKIIDQCFADFDHRWKEVGGDTFYIEKRTNQQSPFGIRTINSNCVAMHCGHRPAGIATIDSSPSCQSFSQVIETSGRLLFSQMPDGHILVLATPPTSDVKKAPFEHLIIHISIPPLAVTYSLVERAIETYLWLQSVASYEGLPTFFDRLRFFRFWVTEWRHANSHAAWVIFWVAFATLFFALISASADIKSLFWSNTKPQEGANKTLVRTAGAAVSKTLSVTPTCHPVLIRYPYPALPLPRPNKLADKIN